MTAIEDAKATEDTVEPTDSAEDDFPRGMLASPTRIRL